ncbi:MAG: ATP-binding protein [Acidobacteriota bacterium]
MKHEKLKYELLLSETRKLVNLLKQKGDALDSAQQNDVSAEVLPIIFHKLKNKLTPILGYTQILQMKLKDDRLMGKVDKVEKNALELKDLFDELKDSFETVPIPKFMDNLNRIILKQKELFGKIRKNTIELEFDLEGSIPPSLFSEGQIGKLLSCIIDNSINSINMKGEKSGKISIKTFSRNDEILLHIIDNGQGLDEEELDFMWMPFYSGAPGKSGLGLLLAEKIISNHMGIVDVESVKGEYCKLKIKFPIRDKEDFQGRKKNNKTRVLFVNFSEHETDLFREIFTGEDQVEIDDVNLGNNYDFKPEFRDYKYVIIDIENFSTYNDKIFGPVLNLNKSASIYVFYKDRIPENVTGIFRGHNVEFVESEMKILKLKNIFTEEILEEE